MTQNLEASMACRASLFQSSATVEESRLPMLRRRDVVAVGTDSDVGVGGGDGGC
jgi:hypothetical protein